MVLEATVMCLDNSEYSRNGDYVPSRLEAQCEAANLICGTKTNDNPENAVGVITTAGDRVVVRVTPTQDLEKILQGLHDVPSNGEADIVRAVQTAQLALKHRMNKNQRQRIVLFVGSPVKATEKQLEQLGRVLKKNNIALDIVSFGEMEVNSSKLRKLHSTVNSNGTSHFVECRAEGTRSIADVIMTSPVIRDGNSEDLSGVPGAQTAGAEGRDGAVNPTLGVDPRTDPELYMALQISFMEEQERQARAAAASESVAAGAAGTATTPTTTQDDRDSTTPTPPLDPNNPTIAQIQATENIDEDLRQALLISMVDCRPEPSSGNPEITSISNASGLHPSASVEVAHGDDLGIIPPDDAAEPGRNLSLESISNEESLAAASNTNAFIKQLLEMPGVDVDGRRLLDTLQLKEQNVSDSGSDEVHDEDHEKTSDDAENDTESKPPGKNRHNGC